MLLPLVLTALAAPLSTPHALDHARHSGADHVVPAPLASVPPPADGPTPDMTVYGYHAYWTGDPTDLNWEQLTHVAIFDVELNSDGTLSSTDNWTDVAGSVVPIAHSYGVKVHVCVISFDDDVQASVLSSPSKRAVAIAELKALVEDYGADGVNVDVEGLDSDLTTDFVDFIKELHDEVGEVYIATPAVDWLGAWDYSELAANSEGLFIMGYGYHWTGGDPGPNDPLYGEDPWSDYSLEWTIDDYIAFGAPVDKIVLGLPLYGQEWPADHNVPGDATDDGWSVVMSTAIEDAAENGELYDQPTRSPYTLPSGTQLWYPTNESVRLRIAFARDRGLQGVGFWALDYEGEDFWPMVAEETTFDEPSDTAADTAPVDSDTDPADTDSGDQQAQVLGPETPSGCGCATSGGGSLGGFALGLLGLALARRSTS